MALHETAERACAKLGERGYRGAVLSTGHIAELRHEIEEWLGQGAVDKGLYDSYLTHFKFDAPADAPKARSAIITAAPQPQRKITFHLGGRPHPVIVPPTYHRDTDDGVRCTLQDILGPNGYQLRPAALPVKLLAVRSGMAEYGKNNIAYVEGMGSFVRLKAFLSDMPAGRGDWPERRVMEECDGCQACLKGCPTGAIVADRFLIHAERCLTFLNERPEPFPDWVDPAWHNSLIGCMKCQLVCPANKRFAKWLEQGEDFDETETELILKGIPADRMPPQTADKLRRACMLESLDVLPRNLRALLR
jgi:epoxyqueuosine reductase